MTGTVQIDNGSNSSVPCAPTLALACNLNLT